MLPVSGMRTVVGRRPMRRLFASAIFCNSIFTRGNIDDVSTKASFVARVGRSAVAVGAQRGALLPGISGRIFFQHMMSLTLKEYLNYMYVLARDLGKAYLS